MGEAVRSHAASMNNKRDARHRPLFRTACASDATRPASVDAAYRGLGVFPRLFETMRLGMCERYPIGVTFINRLNPHSYHAHTKKLGMTVIDEFEFNGRPYYGLAFDMARSVLGGAVG